ncbi:hypothetical protein EVAR_18516_1 [Eumeta japonica]|uniref:Mariner Mos1 transposase n=1 Tax=Eumeta variegata TaxID=151549 RepID=A0A4C1V132_EUMVA|nr:hypothetical protein EVAR_18516_1 [Eumeta japonica]
MHKILHDYLAVTKLCTRWILYNLTEAQKLRHGSYATILLEDKITVTADCYTNNYSLLVLEKENRDRRRISRILLRHCNASPHSARQKTNYLGMLGIESILRKSRRPPRPPPSCTAHPARRTALCPYSRIFRSQLKPARISYYIGIAHTGIAAAYSARKINIFAGNNAVVELLCEDLRLRVRVFNPDSIERESDRMAHPDCGRRRVSRRYSGKCSTPGRLCSVQLFSAALTQHAA